MTRAMAARTRGADLTSFEFESRPLHPGELEVAVESCALCHSDLHLIDGDWSCEYPLVPGHEIVGRVIATGRDVDPARLGERVGIGWQCGSCGSCEPCTSDRQHLCATRKMRTCVSQFGGFAETARSDAAFAHPIPEAISSAHAAPLMCAGLTVFSALDRLVSRPGMKVGVIGIGGLGHLAVQFAAQMSCHVTAFDVSEERLQFAASLGATAALDATASPTGSLDLLLSTTSADLDWNSWLGHLTWGGTLCLVGYPSRAIAISPDVLIDGQKNLTGSVIGSPSTMRRMLAFAAQHDVRPVVEEMPMSRADEAIARLRANDVRYRMVLSMDLGR